MKKAISIAITLLMLMSGMLVMLNGSAETLKKLSGKGFLRKRYDRDKEI